MSREARNGLLAMLKFWGHIKENNAAICNKLRTQGRTVLRGNQNSSWPIVNYLIKFSACICVSCTYIIYVSYLLIVYFNLS